MKNVVPPPVPLLDATLRLGAPEREERGVVLTGGPVKYAVMGPSWFVVRVMLAVVGMVLVTVGAGFWAGQVVLSWFGS